MFTQISSEVVDVESVAIVTGVSVVGSSRKKETYLGLNVYDKKKDLISFFPKISIKHVYLLERI
jgi:hypothetical protein